MAKYFGLFGEGFPGHETHFAEIAAANFGEALDLMKAEYGDRWSILLDEDEFMGYGKKVEEGKRPALTKWGRLLC